MVQSVLDQVGQFSKRRLVEQWDDLSPDTMQKVDEAIKVSLGLTPL